MKKTYIITLIVSSLVLIVAGALLILAIRTASIKDDYSSIFTDEKYSEPVSCKEIEVITQEVSCGYAVIEMFASWSGKNITEESLYETYGKVVTSTGKNFCKEMNKQFPEHKTTMHKYLKNTELIDTVYQSLKAGTPVPFEWAALYKEEWTLHYSLVTGMDIPNNKVTIANPYGYYEEITIEDFLDRTTFEAYKPMPWFLKMGFMFGFFEKNTVFTVD